MLATIKKSHTAASNATTFFIHSVEKIVFCRYNFFTMKTCINCGAQNRDSASACITCGLPLTNTFASPQRTAASGNPQRSKLIWLAVLIALAGVAVFFLMGIHKTKTVSGDPQTKAESGNLQNKGKSGQDESIFGTANLRNVDKPGRYKIDDATLGRITTKITHYINKNNKEDIEAMLEYFHYPIYRYHNNYSVSRAKLKKILLNSDEQADEYHFLQADIASGTVGFDGQKYTVVLKAVYSWGTSKSNAETMQMRLKYILNKQLEFTSLYKMADKE